METNDIKQICQSAKESIRLTIERTKSVLGENADLVVRVKPKVVKQPDGTSIIEYKIKVEAVIK